MEIIEELDKKLQELEDIQKSLDRIRRDIRSVGCSILIKLRPKR